jgi:hypothetical protein
VRRWVRLIGDRGKDNRGGDVFVEARGWEEEAREQSNVWGELEKAGWTKERNYDRLCELKAESGSCPTGLKSAFGF